MATHSTPVASAALVVAMLAVVALGSRPVRPLAAPRPRPSNTAIVRGAAIPTGISPSRPLDVNHASARELEALPRVGPALARRIIEARQAAGGFAGLDDLDAVRGIGPSLRERLAPLVVFGPQNRSNTNPQRSPRPSESLPVPEGTRVP